VIAARSDANIDVIQALRKRFPPQDVLFCPASVQGVRAVGSIIDALGRLQAVEDVDVIVLARGGGSTADLVPFDDERLCRAIFACAVPVITSIGHTKDRPNCDRVAAAFAPVPAKAAELAISRSAIELLDELDGHRRALADIWRRSQALRDAVSHSWSAARPRRSLVSKADELVRLGELLRSKAQIDLQRRETCLTSDVRGLGLAMRRAPRASAVEELGRDLIRRAEARSAGQARDVEEIARRLHDAASLARHVSGLEVSSARLQAAHGRLTRKLLDLRAAMERRSAEGRRELRRNLNLCLQQVDREAQRLRPVADRILERACERVEALAAITRAKDFRARGWVMATDIAGKPIRGVATLSKEQKLRLCFADGEAAATITDITQGEMT
jgi:exonuclease VII large subunit